MNNTAFQVRTISGPVRVVDVRSPLSALRHRAVVSVPSSCTVRDAVDRMRAASVSAVLVDGGPGVVTERDVTRATGTDVSPDDPVSRVMTPAPRTVPATTTVLAAAELMLDEQVRHLVVVADDGSVDVVSMRDVLAVLLQAVEPRIWLRSLRMTVDTPSELWLG